MFTLPPLNFPFDALEPYIDAKTMEIHHDKHHATYVKNLNEALMGEEVLLKMELEELIKNLDKVPEEIRTKVKNNGGGHLNHSLFWNWLTPHAKTGPTGKLMESINSTFGSLDTFKEKFEASGIGRFGSGWVWLVSEDGKVFITDTANQDNPVMEGKVPVLGLDVWEHAYYLKYQNRRADYIKAWWSVVNWEEAEKIFEKSSI